MEKQFILRDLQVLLIGYALIRSLASANKEMNLDIKMIVLVRNKECAEKKIKQYTELGILSLVGGTTASILKCCRLCYSWSQLASKEFVDYAVETKKSVIDIMNLLEFAKEN